VAEYAAPTAPDGSDDVPIVRAATTLIVHDWEAVAEALSATCKVKFAAPAVVGVPEIAPELLFRFNPVGSCPAVIDHK
jgi:hypothetical protein